MPVNGSLRPDIAVRLGERDTMRVGEEIERIAFVADNPGKSLIGAGCSSARTPAPQFWLAVG